MSHKLRRLTLLLLTLAMSACGLPKHVPQAAPPTIPATATAAATATVAPTATILPTLPPTFTPAPTPTQSPRDVVVAQLMPAAQATLSADWIASRPPAFDAEKDTLEGWVRGYIQLITAMLNATGDVDAVLDQLIAWLPADSTYEGPRPPNAWATARDLNADGEDEWLISVPARDLACGMTFCPGYLLVFHQRAGLFVPASIIIADERVWEVSFPNLLTVADINADGKLEVVIESHECGAHTCFTSLLIGQWDGQRWYDLAAAPIMQAYTDYTLADDDGDGILEVVMHGGMFGSVGAGLQRQHTLRFDWRDGAYRLVEDTPDPDPHPYFQMLDANTALANEDWDTALDLALSVINHPGIYTDEGWLTAEAWARIVGYATVEAMLVYAERGDVAALRQVHADLLARTDGAPNTLYAAAAGYVLEVYEATDDALAACLAVESFIGDRVEAAAFFDWYGYGTERFTLDRICPLDQTAEIGPEL
ncbi:MAG TPA: hypothetical protein PKZ84_14910 [Anaerolineae bacterium]|mgnify:CR=1 FL=1|nr:hypothetical protein [Anaerolineae bacterium]HQI84668.1 hypothetical protein [Anaerolineae bacterium]